MSENVFDTIVHVKWNIFSILAEMGKLCFTSTIFTPTPFTPKSKKREECALNPFTFCKLLLSPFPPFQSLAGLYTPIPPTLIHLPHCLTLPLSYHLGLPIQLPVYLRYLTNPLFPPLLPSEIVFILQIINVNSVCVKRMNRRKF